jgi:hypothetical protein
MIRKLNIDKTYRDTTDRRPAGNSGFAKKRVQWLIKLSTSHQLFCYVDSFELRNSLLRKAAKRCVKPGFLILTGASGRKAIYAKRAGGVQAEGRSPLPGAKVFLDN